MLQAWIRLIRVEPKEDVAGGWGVREKMARTD
jgi:hypothetical protein